jgi:hypothetical protein
VCAFGEQKLDKYSPAPAPGERLSVLLDVRLADVVEVTEEEDPRKITITVRAQPLEFYIETHTQQRLEPVRFDRTGTASAVY